MEITILNEVPVIMTKDNAWIQNYLPIKFKAGLIILLPDDAVLVNMPVKELYE